LGGSELFRSRFEELRTRLVALARAEPLELALTEYHVADGFSRGKFLLGDTAAVGLGLADMLVLFAQLGVEHACQHLSLAFGDTQELLLESWYNPFLADAGGDLIERPAYTVTRLFANMLLPREGELVAVKAPATSVAFAEQSQTYPLVHAAAFASADGREGSLFLLHRDLHQSLTATFDLEEGFAVVEARLWAPTRFDQDASQSAIAVVDSPFRLRGRRVQVVIPPHSVLALRVRR